MVYAFIEAEKARFPVAFMCARLGVSRAGFCERRIRQHTPAARTLADRELTGTIRQIRQSRGIHGAPRVHAELVLGMGMKVGRKRVARLMRAECLVGVTRRRRHGCTRGDIAAIPSDDRVNCPCAVQAALSGSDSWHCAFPGAWRFMGGVGTKSHDREGPLVLGILDLAYPFRGRWLVQNSPANRVPSHGTTLFASSYAIDFVPVDERGRSAKLSLTSFLRPEPPERFPGFGRTLTAPVHGVVVAVHDGEPDHEAFRGIPSIRYALTQPQRAATGWAGLAGNHVFIRMRADALVALCHLRRGSIRVSVGQAVAAGDVIGQCGNSGNSTEPHVHLQGMDSIDPRHSRAIPISFHGGLPRNREIVEVP